MLGELLPRGGGDSVPLLKKKLLIGRRSNCDIVLEFPNVSSQHCELELLNGYWRIKDLKSSNGLKVNGERCDQKFLMPGDEISIARHHFVISYQPSGDAPATPPVEEEDPFAMSLLEKAGLQQRREEQRRLQLPPAARKKPDSQLPGKFSADEDAAARWLSED